MHLHFVYSGFLFLILCWMKSSSAGVGGTKMDQYIEVPHIPRANTEITYPSVKKKHYCAGLCLLNVACKGFVFFSYKVNSCRLLIDFSGVNDPMESGVEAYVTIYYDGKRHEIKTRSQSWNQGLAYCQSVGKEMISYPLSMEKRQWLTALNTRQVLIGGKKNPSDNYRVYDINTNIPLTVDLRPNDGGTIYSNVIALLDNQFRTLNDWYVWSSITLICAPLS